MQNLPRVFVISSSLPDLLRCDLQQAASPEGQMRGVGKARARSGSANRHPRLQERDGAPYATLDDVTVHWSPDRVPESQLQVGHASAGHKRQLFQGEVRILQVVFDVDKEFAQALITEPCPGGARELAPRRIGVEQTSANGILQAFGQKRPVRHAFHAF